MRVRHASSSIRDSGRNSLESGLPAVTTRVGTTGPDPRRVDVERAEDAVDVVGGAGRARAGELTLRRQQPVGELAHDVVLVRGEELQGHAADPTQVECPATPPRRNLRTGVETSDGAVTLRSCLRCVGRCPRR